MAIDVVLLIAIPISALFCILGCATKGKVRSKVKNRPTGLSTETCRPTKPVGSDESKTDSSKRSQRGEMPALVASPEPNEHGINSPDHNNLGEVKNEEGGGAKEEPKAGDDIKRSELQPMLGKAPVLPETAEAKKEDPKASTMWMKKSNVAKVESSPKVNEPVKVEPVVESSKVEPAKGEPTKVEPVKVDSTKVIAPVNGPPPPPPPPATQPPPPPPPKVEPAKVDPLKPQPPVKVEPPKVPPVNAQVPPPKVEPPIPGVPPKVDPLKPPQPAPAVPPKVDPLKPQQPIGAAGPPKVDPLKPQLPPAAAVPPKVDPLKPQQPVKVEPPKVPGVSPVAPTPLENVNPHIITIPTEMQFKAVVTNQTKLTIKSIHDKKVMFKIKLSDNVTFQVNPVFGVVDPGKTVDVAVTHVKSTPKEAKMVILNNVLTGDEKNVENLFKTITKPTGGQVTVKLAAQ